MISASVILISSKSATSEKYKLISAKESIYNETQIVGDDGQDNNASGSDRDKFMQLVNNFHQILLDRNNLQKGYDISVKYNQGKRALNPATSKKNGLTDKTWKDSNYISQGDNQYQPLVPVDSVDNAKSAFQIQNIKYVDCSSYVSFLLKEFIDVGNYDWATSTITSSIKDGYKIPGFTIPGRIEAVNELSDIASRLMPGDILLQSGHVSMVQSISIDKENPYIKVIDAGGDYGPNKDQAIQGEDSTTTEKGKPIVGNGSTVNAVYRFFDKSSGEKIVLS